MKNSTYQYQAEFTFEVIEEVLVIFDKDNGGASVTNDVQNVLDKVQSKIGTLSNIERVIYQDSRGVFDEIRINDRGEFVGFYPVNKRSLSAAMAKIGRPLH